MGVYITLLGRSTWALLNTFYAVANEGKEPDSVHIFVEKSYKDKLETAEEGVRIISDGFGFSPEIKSHIVNDAKFKDALSGMKETLQDLFNEENRILIDITPGRKALVAGALLSASRLTNKGEFNIDRIFYLAIETTEDVAKPYYMLPMEIQKLREMREEMKQAESENLEVG
ncbi:hypothetical protein AKJ51_00375 [candidate division MSBL1 archaeon SCGC-AAA382A20]|uniref:CRISPR system ring nuclease SSO1393-like domain-containing protein n=1 Tax=candidate division MSBL1 archaeon SCGC-AAA382A20 TaxID=1698280 RepID=A0A133VMN4_9EURY|nr:hypothetical protein AKJ51_00375 [candidate division MSBL1 archaeon SCGC-AAA382A20]